MDKAVSAWLDYAAIDRGLVKEAMPFGGAWLLALILAGVYWWYVGDKEWGRRETVAVDHDGHWTL